MSMSPGSVGRIRAISAWSRLATSISLLPGSGQTPMYTASLSLNLVMKSASSAPSSTRATSDSRTIGALYLHHRWLGLGGQLGAHLLQPRGDLRQRRRAVVVQLQVHSDARDAGAAGGFDVVDARDGRHGALDRRREEAAHGFGAGAVVHRRDQPRRALNVRILLYRQRRDRPPPHQHDHEVDDDREDRMLDERIGKGAHERFPINELSRPRPAQPRAA